MFVLNIRADGDSDSFKAEKEEAEEKIPTKKRKYNFCTCDASFQKALAIIRFHLSK